MLPEESDLSAQFPEDDDAVHPWQDLLFTEPENFSQAPELLLPPSASTMASLPGGIGSGPRLGPETSIAVWNHRVRDQFTNSAQNGCNWDATNDAVEALTSETGGRVYQACVVYNDQWSGWDPCINSDGYRECTQDSATLLKRLRTWVHDWAGVDSHGATVYPFADNINMVNIAWLQNMENNGIAYRDGWAALAAEKVPNKDDWPHRAIVLHELGHLFYADDFPYDGWPKYKPNACAWYGCATYDSVMNYYWASSGHMEFKDGQGGDVGVVIENVKDVSPIIYPIPESLPLHP